MKYRQCSWPTNELKHVTCDRCITIKRTIAAVMELPDKQAKWIYARFYLGMTIKEIAKVEGVDLSWVYKSIKRGLKRLRKKVQKV